MTITRQQLRDLRDMARADAKGHSDSVCRHLHKLATECDSMDAVMAREGIEHLWGDGGRMPEAPAPAEEPPKS